MLSQTDRHRDRLGVGTRVSARGVDDAQLDLGLGPASATIRMSGQLGFRSAGALRSVFHALDGMTGLNKDRVEPPVGIEPTTYRLQGDRSGQLS